MILLILLQFSEEFPRGGQFDILCRFHLFVYSLFPLTILEKQDIVTLEDGFSRWRFDGTSLVVFPPKQGILPCYILLPGALHGTSPT